MWEKSVMPSPSGGKSCFINRAVHWIVLAIFVFLGSGCGGPGEPLGRVFGTVTYQGQPFSEAEVVFSNESRGIHMTVALDNEGSYEVQTSGESGLPPGDYKVALHLPRIDAVTKLGPQPKLPPRRFPDIPQRYRSPKTSNLSLTVVEDDNQFDIDLSP